MTAQEDFLAQDMGFAMKPSLPKVVTQDDERRGLRILGGFRFQKCATQERFGANHLEIIAGDLEAGDSFAAIPQEQIIEGPIVTGQDLERSALFLPIGPLFCRWAAEAELAICL